MSRIVSVWLPRWPIKRFLAAQAISCAGKPIDPERSFVLAIPATGGLRIAAINEAAEDAGIVVGDPVADARAKADSLQVRAADSAADDDALHADRLAVDRGERRRRFFSRHRRRRASVRRQGKPACRSCWPA